MDQGIPAILLGDFNTPSRLDWTPETVGLREQIHYPVNWPTSRFVEDAGFLDSYREAHPDPVENQGLTWPSGRPHPPGEWSPGPNAPADRIDFIYTAGTIETLGSDLVGESGGPDVTIAVDPWGTDHRAIVSELSVEGGVMPTLVAVRSRLVEAGPTRRSRSTARAGRTNTSWCSRRAIPSSPVADELVPGRRSTARWTLATDGWDPGTYVVHLRKDGRPSCRGRASGSKRWVTARTCRRSTGVSGSAIRSRCAGGTLPATDGTGWGCTNAAPIPTSPPTSRGSTRDRRSGVGHARRSVARPAGRFHPVGTACTCSPTTGTTSWRGRGSWSADRCRLWLSSRVDIERLRQLPLFGELDHHDLSQLMRWVREVEVADGDLLFEQGSMPHDLFVIEEGSVEVVRDGRSVARSAPARSSANGRC